MTHDEAVKCNMNMGSLSPVRTEDGVHFYIALGSHTRYLIPYYSCGVDYLLNSPRPLTPGNEYDELCAYIIFMESGVDPLAERVEGFIIPDECVTC